MANERGFDRAHSHGLILQSSSSQEADMANATVPAGAALLLDFIYKTREA